MSAQRSPLVSDPGPSSGTPQLYEAARCSARTASPDHDHYRQVADRLGGQRAALSVARKLARRCHHRLRALGEHALAPPA